MEINRPEVVREVTECFQRYEDALINNRPDLLIDFFWNSPHAVRYGVAENLYGFKEIAEYRAARAKQGGAPKRTLVRTVTTTYGFDFATVNTEYVRAATGRIGRQSQSWMRTVDGWRIVSAHVSLMQETD